MKEVEAEYNHVLRIYVLYEIFPMWNMKLSLMSFFLRSYIMIIAWIIEMELPLVLGIIYKA